MATFFPPRFLEWESFSDCALFPDLCLLVPFLKAVKTFKEHSISGKSVFKKNHMATNETKSLTLSFSLIAIWKVPPMKGAKRKKEPSAQDLQTDNNNQAGT